MTFSLETDHHDDNSGGMKNYSSDISNNEYDQEYENRIPEGNDSDCESDLNLRSTVRNVFKICAIYGGITSRSRM